MKTLFAERRLQTVLAVVAVVILDRLAAGLTGGEGSLLGFAEGAHTFGELGMLALFGVGHCDTLDGPLIKLARKALETGNVNQVLPWVPAEGEAEVRRAFEHAQAVRKLDKTARELADRFFFETLVRVHRASEGAPYTGLKPAGLDLGPAVPSADQALEDGSIDAVVKLLTEAIKRGVHERYHAAMDRKKFDVNDVRAGRQYVEAYVPYVHYVERLWEAATGAAHGHFPEAEHASEAHAVHRH
jgi:hypothetical protein